MNKAIELTPKNSLGACAVLYNNAGAICIKFGDNENAIKYLIKSLKCKEVMGDRVGAGKSRHNIAVHLFNIKHFNDSRDYAVSALSDFLHCGEGALDMAKRTQSLIEDIDRAQAAQGG